MSIPLTSTGYVVSPRMRGVDKNKNNDANAPYCVRLPSYEGSGLKYIELLKRASSRRLPSYEGSGLKYYNGADGIECRSLPSYEGSGLKSVIETSVKKLESVSPRMRGVD